AFPADDQFLEIVMVRIVRLRSDLFHIGGPDGEGADHLFHGGKVAVIARPPSSASATTSTGTVLSFSKMRRRPVSPPRHRRARAAPAGGCAAARVRPSDARARKPR